jgi:hypothetical protein
MAITLALRASNGFLLVFLDGEALISDTYAFFDDVVCCGCIEGLKEGEGLLLGLGVSGYGFDPFDTDKRVFGQAVLSFYCT